MVGRHIPCAVRSSKTFGFEATDVTTERGGYYNITASECACYFLSGLGAF